MPDCAPPGWNIAWLGKRQMQTTLKRDVTLVGTGLHSGRPVRMVIRPAEGSGIRFRRVDVKNRDNVVPADYALVSDTTLCTQLTNAAGVSVSTVEHLMAAFAGCGIHNALVDLDGPEVPIMDGSAKRFVKAIERAGIRELAVPLTALELVRPVRFVDGAVRAELLPAPTFRVDFRIDFADEAIGRQSQSFALANGAFVHELADCRTFCRRADVEMMQRAGLALGGSLENAIVVDGDRVLNPGGLRRSDEFVRHKMLDAVGDLALAGMPIIGIYKGLRAGHGATNRLLRKVFATPEAWRIIRVDSNLARILPGVGAVDMDLRRSA
jgi:UDP-3-O-[3-hydroxymyristoyl] N-acetylglucosamine deacetylase